MGNLVDKIMFPVAQPENVNKRVDVIPESGIEYIHVERGEYVILYSHGNATTLDKIADALQLLAEKTEYSVFAYEYPQNANELSVNSVMEKVYEYLCLLYDPDHIILMGRSIGSGPTMWMANLAQYQIKCVVLVSPLDSIHRRATAMLPVYFRCFAWFVEERFDNIKRVADLNCPLLLIHGRDDVEIEHEVSLTLHRLHRGSKSECVIIENRGHNNIPMQVIADEIIKFNN